MKRLLIIICILSLVQGIQAQEKPAEKKLFTWQAFAGLNLGATSPVPKPKSVTKVYAWYPGSNPCFGITALYHPSEHHGLGMSIMAERKSFSATTQLKNMKIGTDDNAGEPISGNQRTSFEARYLTMPIFYNASLVHGRINLYAGVYASLLLKSDFQIILDTDPESLDESSFIRKSLDNIVRPMDVGLILGGDFFFTQNLAFTMRLTTGLTSATKDSFAQMSGQNLHNLYAFLGVTYRFK